ncbi:sensor histidine kinase [Paenibacillus mucilaginosus]|uniref:histidine kinase n=3 Tax=Paenibacillus mucilaginosus TaxID=61624 RepID=H6NL03_9BACL|nr:histidine kinase [Paenibacillus mucilaginosus]AEI40697.1 histidine kinase [Paenibacillus mucilaginosus KNP414]AFC29309.1 histidine kinase [Paenibacillus mucilaginosus 3016]AFH61487.1 histidine kinase [Paenibacillus mucilaginosus K02]MCG7211818.1 histidine kinase [Paenibacillus mucilaginosus]WDM29833.1 histidine kinase [Paenibacillus mucilaginosus]
MKLQMHHLMPKTLKMRLILNLILSTSVPLVLIAVMTYSSFYSILENKISSGVQANLKQEALGLENTLTNLSYASKQLAGDERIREQLRIYLSDAPAAQRAEALKEVRYSLSMVNFTNPDIGLNFYYFPEQAQPILFENLTVAPGFSLEGRQPLMFYNGANFYGPHPSAHAKGSTVFSIVRHVEVEKNKYGYVYVESNFNLLKKLMSPEQYGMPVAHVLRNEKGEVLFAESGTEGTAGEREAPAEAAAVAEAPEKLTVFTHRSEQGWELQVAIRQSEYNKEINDWMRRLLLIVCGSLFLSILTAFSIWRLVYRPLTRMNQEISHIVQSKDRRIRFTDIKEFDDSLHNIAEMRQQIFDLIDRIEADEKRKRQLEIEKLLVQINPHFLHNTLNSVQWMARANKQPDIDRIVTLLIKVLHYNMGKQSMIVTVEKELEALRHYIDLQSMRYDYEFQVVTNVDPQLLLVPLPRFVLQPLVENAIYYGSGSGDTAIEIEILSPNGRDMLVRVTDHGEGMDPHRLEEIMEGSANRKQGLGIGLPYVKGLLDEVYGDESEFRITSTPGEGTSIMMKIPIWREEAVHAERNHRG